MKKIIYFLTMTLLIVNINNLKVIAQNNQDFDLDVNSSRHHLHPTINPINENLISYEHDGSIKILYVDENNNQKAIHELKCIIGEVRTAFFADDLDLNESKGCVNLSWRPILDHNNRFWFSYISAAENVIMVGFIDGSLDCSNSAKCKSFQLNYSRTQNIFSANWSPDGHSMAINEGPTIKLIYEFSSLLEDLNPSGFTVHRFNLANLAAFPTWSPDQRFIAYEYDEEGQQRDIHILDFELWSKYGERKITKVSSAFIQLFETEKSKPAWSSDGSLFSFLVPSMTSSEGWDVVITRVHFENDDLHLRLYSSDNREVVNFRRRFPISRGPIILSATNNTGVKNDLILYVDDNPGKQNPVIARLLTPPVNPRTISGNHVNNDHVDAIISNNRVRFAYTSQIDGMMQIRVNSLPLSDVGYVSPQVYTDINRIKVFNTSLLYPGLGQFKKKEFTKGFLFTTGATLLLGSIVYNSLDLKNNKNSFSNLLSDNLESKQVFQIKEYYETLEKRSDLTNRINFNKQAIMISAVAYFGLYIYNLYDVQTGFPKLIPAKNYSVNLDLETITSSYTSTIYAPALTIRLSN